MIISAENKKHIKYSIIHNGMKLPNVYSFNTKTKEVTFYVKMNGQFLIEDNEAVKAVMVLKEAYAIDDKGNKV